MVSLILFCRTVPCIRFLKPTERNCDPWLPAMG